MSLRWRVSAVIVLAAVLPVLTLGVLWRESTEQAARADFEQRLAAAAHAAEVQVEARAAREQAAIERLCEADYVVDRLLLDLEAERFEGPAQAELVAQAPALMRSMGLDVLLLLDGRESRRSYGEVLAAGHFPGRAGARESALARFTEAAAGSFFAVEVAVRDQGVTEEADALLTGCVASRGPARVLVVGGQILDERYIRSLAAEVPPVRLALADASGAIPSSIPSGGGQREVWRFTRLDGEPAFRLVAAVDDRPLVERLEAIDRGLFGTAALALLGALLLGFLLAIRITRPLGELERAASRVASGDVSSTITVRSGGEVGRALEAFNRMTGELDRAQARLIRAERIAAWRDIARRIAHEIKNPLMPIQTSIETMRKTHARQHPDFDEIFEESTLTILEEVGRLGRIVTEFSRFARLPRPKPSPVELAEVVHHVVGLHSGDEGQIVFEPPASPIVVRADREQLTQVLVNLVQNAAEAARARHGDAGRVDVRLVAVEGGAELEIEDDGPGLPPEERARVFEPYYTTKAGGTGLGLAIVHRIVLDHGGRVDVEEGDAGGALFRVFLPSAGPPAEAEGSQTDSILPLTRQR